MTNVTESRCYALVATKHRKREKKLSRLWRKFHVRGVLTHIETQNISIERRSLNGKKDEHKDQISLQTIMSNLN